jgi:hypothetical protein
MIYQGINRKMIGKLISEPYPLIERKWQHIFSFGLFVALFMLIFQPFGLSENPPINVILITAGYGCVSIIILTINYILVPVLFRNWFDKKSWNVLKKITWHTWTIFTIGLGNCIFSSVLNSSWSLHRFFVFQYYTFAVGLIPAIVLTILNQKLMLSRNLKSAKEFNEQLRNKSKNLSGEHIACITSENGKDKLEIGVSNILYIESIGNYIKVVYVKEGKLSNTLLRSTMKRAELQVQDFTSLIKCHRAFLVNISKIVKVKGNSQGLRLILINTETEIPVSRNLSKSLKNKLNTQNRILL